MEARSHKKRLRSSSNASTDSSSGSAERPSKACRSQRGDTPTDIPIDQPNIIHRVNCSRASEYHSDHPLGACYLDVPALPANGNRATALHGQKPLLDVESYLAGCIDLKFVVYLEYDCEAYHKRIEDRFTRLPMPSMPHSMIIQSKPYFQILRYDGPPAKAESERIQLSESLEKALCVLRDHNKETFKEWKFRDDHVYPYQKLYYFRNMCVEPSLKAPGWQRNKEIAALFHYLAKRLSSSYEELAKLSAAGMADQKYWAMLFQPDDTVVTTQNGQCRAFTVSSSHLIHQNMLIMNCWSWEYDGNFFRKQTTLSHVWPSSSERIRITELPVYPLRYAADGVESGLRERGETFWACRRQKYVNYNVPPQGLGSQLV
ncbi:AAA ATPase [Alternaria alternata]|nr:AAA ATPase [Alternaria alternata]